MSGVWGINSTVDGRQTTVGVLPAAVHRLPSSKAMPDLIIYFGPLEFAVIALALALVPAAVVLFWRGQARRREHRRLLDSLPYPALLFAGKRVAEHNGAAVEWLTNLDVLAIAADSQRNHHNIVRTIPAVEGQAFQAR